LAIMLSFLIVFGSGVIVYFIYAKLQKKWPYIKEEDVVLEEAIEAIGE
jgi:transposase